MRKQLQSELWLVLNSWTTRKRLIRHFVLSLIREIQCLHHLVSYRQKGKVLQEVSLWNLEIPTQVPEHFSNREH